MTLAKLTGLYVALTVFTLFSGCSKKQSARWLIGEWEFDRDMTTANLPPRTKTTTGASLIEQLIAQGDKRTMSFTSTQANFTPPNNTWTIGYIILEEPDDNTLVIQTDDGYTRTFTRSGEFLLMASNDVQIKTYFRRKN
jgi:hypothetical protein